MWGSRSRGRPFLGVLRLGRGRRARIRPSSSTRPTSAVPPRQLPRRAPSPSPPLASFSSARRRASSRRLPTPPLLAAWMQLNLMVGLDVLSEISLGRCTAGGLECILSLGGAGEPKPARSRRGEGRPAWPFASLAPRRLEPPLRRRAPFGEPYAAVVGRLGSVEPTVADAFLAEAAVCLGPVVEREQLLEHSAQRERMLVAASERRLMRLELRPARWPNPGRAGSRSRRSAPAAAGLSVRARGVPRSGVRPLRRPELAPHRARP